MGMNQKDNIREVITRRPVTLGSTDGTPEADKRVLFRLGHANGWTWTAYEADEVEMDDILCFGRVDGFESELGYFSVDEVLDAGGFAEIPE
jgi:hypothetical protein